MQNLRIWVNGYPSSPYAAYTYFSDSLLALINIDVRMKHMKLNDCLNKYNSVLGENLVNLGGYIGKGCNRKKVLLSFSDKKGWSVRKLNLVQLFFRKILITQKSTHRKHIIKHINQIEEGDKKVDYIKGILAKRKLIGLGNAKFSKANVICIAEKHYQNSLQATYSRIINKYYRKGDVILIEGQQANHKLNPDLNNDQAKYFHPSDYDIFGWEPLDTEIEATPSQKIADKMANECITSYKDFINFFNSLEKSNLEFEDISKKANLLKEKIECLNKYYQSNSDIVVNANHFIDEALGKLKNNRSDLSFMQFVKKAFVELDKNHEKAALQNVTEEDIRVAKKTLAARNDSLIREINKYRKEGRRVWVIAGQGHFLHGENDLNFSSVTKVQICLKKHKHVIFVDTKEYSRKLKKYNYSFRKFSSKIA